MFKFCPNCGKNAKEVVFNSFKCHHCHKTFYFNSKPTASIIPIFNGEVLVAIRGIEPFKGAIDTVGGFLKNGEDPLEGAVREFKEETGFDLSITDLEFLGFIISDYLFDGDELKILNILYTIKVNSKPYLKANDDISDLVWLPITGNNSNHPSTKFMDEVFEKLKSKFK